jgi:hypothetical protein
MPDILTPAELRAAHKAVLTQVKTTTPIGPERLALLQRLDAIAIQIRAAETSTPMKAQSK